MAGNGVAGRVETTVLYCFESVGWFGCGLALQGSLAKTLRRHLLYVFCAGRSGRRVQSRRQGLAVYTREVAFQILFLRRA